MNMNKIIWYLKLARLDRPVGIFLLLWPTLWALLFASNGNLKILNVLVFLAGVVLTRSAGCVINDIFDRNIDANVQRTSLRPLAQNKISLMGAVIFFCYSGNFVTMSVINIRILCYQISIFVFRLVNDLSPHKKSVCFSPIFFSSGI